MTRGFNKAVFGAALAALTLLFAVQPAAAQDDPQQRLEALIQEMRTLADRGENQREADPWFLQDMREILAKYENVWSVQLYQRNMTGVSNNNNFPGPWQMALGRWQMDYEQGLRSTVRPAYASGSQQNNGGNNNDVGQILGQILSQALNQNQQQQNGDLAAAVLPITVTNLFKMTAVTVLRTDANRPGRVVFGVYQGDPNGGGYRLVLYPDAQNGENTVELIRKSSRGTLSLIEFYNQPININDWGGHKIEWSRGYSGMMEVKLDDVSLFQATDRSFNDPFDGLSILNGAGDFSLAYMEVMGTN